MKIAKKYLPPISLLLISTLGVAYAATSLFTQTFPAIPAVSGTTSNCTTLTPNIASVAAGSSGTAAFDCSGTSQFGTTFAFVVNTQGGTISITPSFTLPSPYTALGISLGTCGGSVGISSGSALTTGSATYSYCAQYSNAPSSGLPTFSITWTTPTTPFTQAFPALPGSTAITSNCATLTAFDPVSQAHMTSVATGSSGFVTFDCSGTNSIRTTPAFSVSLPGASAAFTPQFTLPTPYMVIGLLTETNSCNAATLGFVPILTSGTALTFTSSGTFEYCTQFQNVPNTGLPTFDVTWTT